MSSLRAVTELSRLCAVFEGSTRRLKTRWLRRKGERARETKSDTQVGHEIKIDSKFERIFNVSKSVLYTRSVQKKYLLVKRLPELTHPPLAAKGFENEFMLDVRRILATNELPKEHVLQCSREGHPEEFSWPVLQQRAEQSGHC